MILNLLIILLLSFSSVKSIISDETITLSKEGETKTFTLNNESNLMYVTIIVRIEANKYSIIYLKSLDNDYKLTNINNNNNIEIEQNKKKTEITIDNTESNYDQDYFITLAITINKITKFEIYYEIYMSFWKKLFIIFGIIVGIGVIIFVIIVCKGISKDIKEKEQKTIEYNEKKENDIELIHKFYELIKSYPFMLNCICPLCFVDRNGKKILENDSYEPILVNESIIEEDTSEEYKQNLIEGIKNKSLQKVISYINPGNGNNCSHFYHKECQQKYKLNKTKEGYYECLFCSEDVTPNNIKAFCQITEDEFNNIEYCYFQYNTKFKKKLNKQYSYFKSLKKAFYQYIYDSPELDNEIKEKIRRARELSDKFYNKNFKSKHFDIPYNDDLQPYEEEFDRLVEKRNRLNRKREELEREERRQRNENNQGSHTKIEMKSKSSDKGEKIYALSCNNCSNKCCFCRSTAPKSGHIYVHKKCYTDKQCITCKNQRGYNSIVPTCTKCKNKYRDKYSQNCYFCNEAF